MVAEFQSNFRCDSGRLQMNKLQMQIRGLTFRLRSGIGKCLHDSRFELRSFHRPDATYRTPFWQANPSQPDALNPNCLRYLSPKCRGASPTGLSRVFSAA